MSKKLIFIEIILSILFSIIACIPLLSKSSAFQGRHFIIGFMQNEIPRTDLSETFSMSIFISTTQLDTVIINVPGKEQQIEILNSNQILEIKVPNNLEIKDVGVIKDKLIDIRAGHPIVCWAYSSKNQSSDSYIALPVSIWGNEYRVVSMPNDKYNGKQRQLVDGATDANGVIKNQAKYEENITARSGEFLVIAGLDGTQVTYAPTCSTRNGVNVGSTSTVILNAGEALFVQASADDIGTNDLTSTLVKSNNPIGLISGHARTAIKQGLDYPYDTKDHLLEMPPPTKAWGKKFISTPFIDGQNKNRLLCASGDLIRVMSREDATVLKYSIHKEDTLFEVKTATIKKAGDYIDIEAASTILWEADKPVMISQFMMHKGISNDLIQESTNYDPSYVILTPIEQYIEEVTFSTPSNSKIFEQYRAHCIIIVGEEIAIRNLTLDGVRMNENNTDIWCRRVGNSNYHWSMKIIKNGTHKLTSDKKNFSGIIYGQGPRDSYSMTLGARLNDPTKEDTIPPIVEYVDSCGQIHIHITDILPIDSNATGIDLCYIKNVVNYTISHFDVSDTATVLDIYASPIDKTRDGSFEIEVIDKNYNYFTKKISHSGFNIDYPKKYDFQMLNWINPTTAILKIKNNGSAVEKLLSMIQPSDSRMIASFEQQLPYNILPMQTINIKLVFTPDGSINSLNTQLTLVFDCEKLIIDLIGQISAPGLLAYNLDFEKVRLFSSKTLVGKIHNAGNIAVTVDSIKKDITEFSFGWTLNKTLPLMLPIDDSVQYSVVFTPTELRTYQENLDVKNDNGLNCTFWVKGEGGAPNIAQILLDWGKHRIGTKSDTIVYIANTGNFNDTINYKSNISISHNTDLSVDSITKIKNIEVQEIDSIPLKLAFYATDTLPMTNIYELSSNWSGHQPIYATINALGTIPQIAVFDYDFGDVAIYSTINHNHNIIRSFGNESLTIDSISVISGDINSFIIDYEQLKDLLIQSDSFHNCPISFNPTHKGIHKIQLAITHDANPAFVRSVDTVEISGNCVTFSNDFECELIMPILYSCQTDTAILRIKNNSLGEIIIDSISLETVPVVYFAKFTDDMKTILPIVLLSGEEIEFQTEIYAERNKEGNLFIHTHYNDENKITLTAPIEPITAFINTELGISANTILPGDTLLLKCKSIFSSGAEKKFNFKINLQFNKKMFYCLEKKCYINVLQNGKSKILEAIINQYIDRIEFELPDYEIEHLIDGTILEFEIPLLAMLASDKTTQFNFTIASERCYDDGLALLDVEVQPVCGDGMRQFEFDGFAYLMINQNPVTDVIDFTINLMATDNIILTITDLSGNVVYAQKDLALAKGKHNLKIDVSNIVNGIYFISASSNQLNVIQKFIFAK